MQNKILYMTALLAALLVIVMTSSPPGGTAALAAENPSNTNLAYSPLLEPANPGETHIVMQGTMWQPEVRKGFGTWRPFAWGVQAKRKATGYQDQWVHIGVPLMTYHEGIARKIKSVEFCAKSSNGAVTKPIWMDLYDNDVSIGQYAISWPADNAYHCFSKTFSPATWRSSLGVSVMLRFPNATDTITLYKAWVNVTD
ncbi:MAG: hypothetical protein HY741_10710 [Chloroflexi bacterium]|nr:hypothetical protein [Chloroflexota bacterium]